MNGGLDRSSSFGILVAATLYFFLNALTQGLVSPTADLDQAQQLLLSQDRAWGYGAQPPLYTWIVHTLFSLTGPSLGVLLGLKALLLGAMMLGAFLVARQLGLEGSRQQAALIGFAFIPQIVWEAQRDLTHSVLATVLGMWTLWAFLALRRAPQIRGYLMLGVLMALGVMGKYNYLIFMVALLVAGLATPSYRPRVWNPRMLLSLLVAVCILLPHLAWILSHQDVATASAHKFKMDGGFTLRGLGSLGMAMLAFSAPLLLAAGLSRSKQNGQSGPTEERRILGRLLGVMILLLALSVLVSGATNVKDRWLQPLLFFLPLFVASVVAIRMRMFSAIAIALLTLVAVILPGRTLLAEWSGKVSRPNLPYAAGFDEIRKEVGKPALIVSDSELLAGNMRLAFSESRIERVLTPAGFQSLAERFAGKSVLFVSEGELDAGWFGKLVRQLESGDSIVRMSETPLLYVPDKKFRMNWLLIRNDSMRKNP